MAMHYVFKNKNIEVEWQKCGESVGVALAKWPYQQKVVSFGSQFSYQNPILLIKFHNSGKFFVTART